MSVACWVNGIKQKFRAETFTRGTFCDEKEKQERAHHGADFVDVAGSHYQLNLSNCVRRRYRVRVEWIPELTQLSFI